MVANGGASKEDMTPTGANSVEKDTSRTFVLEPAPTTHATNCSFNDAFRKVDDAVAPSPPARSKKLYRVFT
jgi:hypothetical protein